MSNLDFEDDILNEMHTESSRATTNAILGAQGNPQHAQRAIQLEVITGTPAAIAQGDIESEEINARGALAGQIVQSNPALQRYVNRNVLAPTLSNDDWAVLDGLTNRVKHDDEPWEFTKSFVTAVFKSNPEAFGLLAEGLAALYPSREVAEHPELPLLAKPYAYVASAAREQLEKVPGFIKAITPELEQYKPTDKRLRDINIFTETSEAGTVLASMAGQGLGSMVPIVAGAILGGVAAGPPGAAVGALTAGAPLSYGEVYKALKEEGVSKEDAAAYSMIVLPGMLGLDYAGLAAGPLGTFLGLKAAKEVATDAVKQYALKQVAKNIAKGIVWGGFAEGTTEFLQEMLKNATVSTVTSKPFFSIDTAYDALEAFVGGAIVGGPMHGAGAFLQQRQEMHDLANKMRPYAAAGVEPPIGIDKNIDKFKADQSKTDLKELDDQFTEAQKSTTRERSPETFDDLVRRETNAKVYIPFDQVAKLYGDNVPQPGDGILGDVPFLREQLRTMALTQGDIIIPKSYWLSSVTPEVADELHDFVRVRRTGFSVESLKEYEEEQAAIEQAQQAQQPQKAEPEKYTIRDFLGAATDEETMEVQIIRHADGSIALLTDQGITKVAPAYMNLPPEQMIAATFGSHPQGAQPDPTTVTKKVSAKEPTEAAMVEGWHGSKSSFKAFDWQYIGSGQGAQTYSVGHYVGEERRVGESYKDTGLRLSATEYDAQGFLEATQGNRTLAIEGAERRVAEAKEKLITEKDITIGREETVNVTGVPHTNIDVRIRGQDHTVFMTVNNETGVTSVMGHRAAGVEVKYPSREAAFEALVKERQEVVDEKQKTVDLLKSGWEKPRGNLYRVRIHADPEDFMDWDLPLSKQSPQVQRALGLLGFGAKEPRKHIWGGSGDLFIYKENEKDIVGALGEVGKTFEGKWRAESDGPRGEFNTKEEAMRVVEEFVANVERRTSLDISGSRIYQEMTDRMREEAGKRYDEAVRKYEKGEISREEYAKVLKEQEFGYRENQAAASKRLLQAGIPGVRYLDQGSRALPPVYNPVAAALKDRLGVEGALANLNARLQKEKDAAERTWLQTAISELEGQKQTFNYVVYDDALIEILDRNGEAVEAVREQAALNLAPDMLKMLVKISDTLSAVIPLPEEMSPVEKVLDHAVRKALERIAPKLRHAGARQILIEGETARIHGVSKTYKEAESLILWVFNSPNALGTARHEVLHYLRRDGFITDGEWEALRKAAIEGDWIGKHGIMKRYPDATPEYAIEEAIAEEYSKVWAMQPNQAKSAANTVFEKLHMIFVMIKEELAKALGFTPTADEIFKMIESGEIGSREGTKKISLEYVSGESLFDEAPEKGRKAIWRNKDTDLPVDIVEEPPQAGPDGRQYQKVMFEGKESFVPLDELIMEQPKAPATGKKAEQLELDVTRQEDKPIFKTGPAIGINTRTLNNILSLIEERNVEDIEAQRKRAIAWQKKVQSAAWKEESDQLEDEVRTELKNRSDIAAVDFFTYGELYGQKLDKKYKLNEALLTPEQRALLPEHWVGKGGINPDDAAGLFGYQTAAKLIDHLAAVVQVRGNIRPGEFFLRLVKAETQRQMIERHGNLEENILAEAEEHVLGPTQMDLLHELTVAFGELSKRGITFSKEDTKLMAGNAFLASKAEDVDVQGFLTDSGKAGRKVIEAAASQDWTEALKNQQAQYYAGLMGRDAIKFEKEMTSLNNLMRRLNKREPKGVESDFVNAIQFLMGQAGMNTKRTPQEIKEMMGDKGWVTLHDFVLAKNGEGYSVDLPTDILQGVKPWEEMTVLQRKEFHAALKALNRAGRLADKSRIGDQVYDRKQLITGIRTDIQTLPKRDPKTQGSNLYNWEAWMTKPEEMLKDLDLRKEAGPLWQLFRELANAKHTEFQWEEKLVKKLEAIKGEYGQDWIRGLDTALPNDWFIDRSETGTGLPFNMTRNSMLMIMLNWGNRSSIEKFVVGYFGKDDAQQAEAKIKDWIDTHATKKDWEFAQHLWDIFAEWAPESKAMYRRLGGAGPNMIDAEPIVTPHGTYRGGYFPVLKDHLRNIGTDVSGNALFGPNFQRSTPANSYTISRTGAVVKIDFQQPMDAMIARMRQVIHDISFREPIMEVAKIIGDKSMQSTISAHYGTEYNEQLQEWLKRLASNYNLNEKANGGVLNFSRAVRGNVVAYALPFNANVILSPAVGALHPGVAGRVLGNPDYYTDLAWKHSKEIPHTFQNMDRDYREHFEALIQKKGLKGMAAKAVRAGFWPVAKLEQAFRIITWVAEYEKQMAAGKDSETSAALADSEVRSWHGSGHVVDMSTMMGTTEEHIRWATLFMGFFNTQYNRQRQIAGNIRRQEYSKVMQALYGTVLIPMLFSMALFNKWEKDDNWFTFMAKALILGQAGMIPFGRELGTKMLEGYTPTTPWGSIVNAVDRGIDDIRNFAQGKEIKKPIKDVAAAVGLSKGIPLGQFGRTGQFVSDVNTGRQRPPPPPRDFMDYLRNGWWWFKGYTRGEPPK